MFKILIYRSNDNATAVSFLKVSLKPFQRLVGAAAIGGRSSQRAKLLIVRKRHERVNFGEAERGKTHKWGFSLLNKGFYIRLTAFFFDTKGTKKKA